MQHVAFKRLVLAGLLAVMVVALGFAGDVATFVNLGFSPDSNYYMFGFYGHDITSARPYAEIFVVDTRNNSFVSNGVFRGTYAVAPQPGLNPAGAFYRLFGEAVALAKRYNIDHLNQGRPVYIFLDAGEREDTISFRDFKDNTLWDVSLRKVIEERGTSVSSSFGVQFSLTRTDGRKLSYNAGNPQIKRSNVVDYAVQQVLVAPDNKTVIFVIDRAEKLGNTVAVRYMVETIRLP